MRKSKAQASLFEGSQPKSDPERSKESLKNLNPGDRGKSSLQVRKISKLTPKQIIVENGNRYKRDTGYRIGDMGALILRKANADDLAREEEKQRKLKDSLQRSEEITKQRDALARLFPETLRPSISVESRADFELTFYELSEDQVRKFAELLSRKPL
jgi:hypothetical protein